MADHVNDLFKSLQMLQQGVAQYKVGASLNEANDLVSQINAQQADETTKRAQIQQVASGLAQQMLAAGAEPATSTAAGQTVDPLYGAYGDIAKIGLTAAAAAKAKSQETKPLPISAVDKIQKLDDQLIAGKDLLGQAEADEDLTGIIAGRIPMREWVSPKFASFKAQNGRFFDAYRVAVTGAGASPGELRILNENVPKLTDPPAVYQTKMRKFISHGENLRAKYINNLKRSGRDVSDFEDGAPASGGSAPPADINKYLRPR